MQIIVKNNVVKNNFDSHTFVGSELMAKGHQSPFYIEVYAGFIQRDKTSDFPFSRKKDIVMYRIDIFAVNKDPSVFNIVYYPSDEAAQILSDQILEAKTSVILKSALNMALSNLSIDQLLKIFAIVHKNAKALGKQELRHKFKQLMYCED